VSASTPTLSVEVVTIRSIACHYEGYALVGDMIGLIWVPISSPFKVDSLGYIPVSYNDEDVEKGRDRPGFVVRFLQGDNPAQSIHGVYDGVECNSLDHRSHEILCYKV
jgi:hypothetical protein